MSTIFSPRYHTISHGPGRRPATTFGKFNLRYSRERETLRIRQPLATKDITEALKLRKQTEDEINAIELEGNAAMLKAAVTKYCAKGAETAIDSRGRESRILGRELFGSRNWSPHRESSNDRYLQNPARSEYDREC